MRRFRRTTLIAIFCLAILAGLGFSRKVNLAFSPWDLCIIIPCLALLRRKNLTSLVFIVILGISLGLWRGGIYMQKLAQLKNLGGQNVTLEVSATSDAVYSQATQLEFTANHVQLLQGETLQRGEELAGNFRISGFGEAMIYRGDRLQISGKIYPSRGANQARISYAQLKRVGLDNSWINRFTRRFSAGMQSALPEPNASFGMGLLIGQRSTLQLDIINQLTMVGLLHIVAVSGYNLTILVRAATKIKLRSKYQKLLMSLALIGFFILMTGFSASIVRAAIVSGLGLWAWYYGRSIRSILILAVTATITSLANPFYIWGDPGWYLSFLAFFGVLIISPIVIAKLFRRPPKIIISTAMETLAAEIMTLPLIMSMFGQLSLVGIITNVLIVPLIPFAMLLCAVAAAAGMIVPAMAGWLAWPANLLLTYILDIVHIFAAIPSIFLHRSISTASMIYFYAIVLLVFAIAHKQRSNLRTDIITDKKVE